MKNTFKNIIFFTHRIRDIIKYRTIQNHYKKNCNKFDILITGIPISGLIFHLCPLTITGTFFTNCSCILIYM